MQSALALVNPNPGDNVWIAKVATMPTTAPPRIAIVHLFKKMEPPTCRPRPTRRLYSFRKNKSNFDTKCRVHVESRMGERVELELLDIAPSGEAHSVEMGR